MAERVLFRAEFFRENDLYVGLAPDLEVSSFGDSLEEAKASLREAMEAFLEGVRGDGDAGRGPS